MQLSKAAVFLLSLLAAASYNVEAKSVREKTTNGVKKSAKVGRGGVRGIRGLKERTLQSTTKGGENKGGENKNDKANNEDGPEESVDRETQVPTMTTTASSTVSSTFTTTTTTYDLQEGDSGIVGGSNANSGEFPFYVKFEGSTLCGGSLISPDTILTAAHCVAGGVPTQVRIGGTSYSGGTLANVQCGLTHPQFVENSVTLLNDVAILKLASPVSTPTIPFNKVVGYPSVSGSTLTVIGFGLTSAGGSVASTLQKLNTKFVATDECQATYNNGAVQSDDHICAEVSNAGDCNGDSGGPVFDANGVQVGIVSFGYGGCASNGFQDVYVNVANYQSWIQSYVTGSSCQPAGADTTTDSDLGGDNEPTEENDDTKDDKDDGKDNENQDGDVEDEGDETEDDAEGSDLDVFLDCFNTVVELIQNVLGGEGGDAGGGKNGQGLGIVTGNGGGRGFLGSRAQNLANPDPNDGISLGQILSNFELGGEPVNEIVSSPFLGDGDVTP